MNWSYKINSIGPLAADGNCEFSCEVLSDTGQSVPFSVSCKPSDLDAVTNIMHQRALELAEKFELSEIIPIGETLELEKAPGYQAVIDSATLDYDSGTVEVRYSVMKGNELLASGSLSVSDPGMAQVAVSDAVVVYSNELLKLSEVSVGTLTPLT